MVKNWLLQAKSFDRAWKHQGWRPRSHECPAEIVLDAQADAMQPPAEAPQPDDVLDADPVRPVAKAKRKSKAKPKAAVKAKSKPKAKPSSRPVAPADDDNQDEAASDPPTTESESSSEEPSSSSSSSDAESSS